jgi:hypothetical protein
VHVWHPVAFEPDTAGIVVYVHGYYANVDRAWRQHRLAAQFRESGINALFVVCEAPRSPRQHVAWHTLSALLRAVEHGLRRPLPDGEVVVVGHSAAHRTITPWLDDARLGTVVLLDAMYGDMPELREWINQSPERRLIDVGNLTRPWTDALHATLPDTLVFDDFPSPDEGRLPGARGAQVVYVRSEIGHMPLVTGGLALPMLLRALRLPMVADEQRTSPIELR